MDSPLFVSSHNYDSQELQETGIRIHSPEFVVLTKVSNVCFLIPRMRIVDHHIDHKALNFRRHGYTRVLFFPFSLAMVSISLLATEKVILYFQFQNHGSDMEFPSSGQANFPFSTSLCDWPINSLGMRHDMRIVSTTTDHYFCKLCILRVYVPSTFHDS